MKTTPPTLYLRQLDPIPRFLNADEIARGLSPLDPQKLSVKAGKLLDGVRSRISTSTPFPPPQNPPLTTHPQAVPAA